MGSAQPSLLRLWQSRFKASVASYLKAKAELERINEAIEDGGPDQALIAEHRRAHDRERMLRGVVRGGAQMLIVLVRPWEWKDSEKILDLEIDYGMPGKRSRPLPGVSPSMSKFLEDNR
jgi:hypothetical protein